MTDHHMPDITSINSGAQNVKLHIASGAVYNEPENYVPPDFTNYPIENDYPLLTGGNWIADVDEEGKTYFQREGQPNSEKIYGPVDMIHGILTIHSGAVVDGHKKIIMYQKYPKLKMVGYLIMILFIILLLVRKLKMNIIKAEVH